MLKEAVGLWMMRTSTICDLRQKSQIKVGRIVPLADLRNGYKVLIGKCERRISIARSVAFCCGCFSR
jgi:hypothetical protein